MRLAEKAGHLPERAGKAVLWYSEMEGVPRRDKSVITLPKIASAEFFNLKDGEQFLFHIPTNRDGVWFGGTDENPFLSHLQDMPFRAFCERGENGFYDSLRPPVIGKLEKAMDVKAKRQGDFFFIPIAHPFLNLLKVTLEACGTFGVEIVEEKNAPILGTRHILSGLQQHFRARKLNDGEMEEYQRFKNGKTWYSSASISLDDSHWTTVDLNIGEGSVKAPDHSSLELKTPHIIFQAQGFFDEQAATTAD